MKTEIIDTPPADLKTLIHEFIQSRLQAKLDKLKPDEEAKRSELEATYQPDAWIADAARRVGQIQLATHILKPVHPDARGTSLHSVPKPTTEIGLVGTHSLEGQIENDVVGNAAALDVFKFLNLPFEGRTLLDRALGGDAAFRAALSIDQELANEWCRAFASIAESKSLATSHTLAKQVYFPLGDGDYHLLSPLFPTSLAHTAHQRMREDRFGDAAKAARDARNKSDDHPHGFREYPGLAIQKLGGTKPQNISQLNSERYGENWLLASLPPEWQSSDVRPPWNAKSVFDTSFGRQKRVRQLTQDLRIFLETVGRNNLSIRRHRAQLVEEICDEAHQFAGRLMQLPPGWSADTQCDLDESEQLWLDPLRVHHDEEFRKRRLWGDWPDEASQRFGNWLNGALSSKKLALGEDEHAQWTSDLVKELMMFKDILEEERQEDGDMP
jgi:CRISPR-associated protein Csy1